MISYTTRYLNIVSFVITILIYLLITKTNVVINKIDFNSHSISNMFKRSTVLVELNSSNINQETKEENEKIQNNQPTINTKDEKVKKTKQTKEIDWKITIPKISLEAEISEGTSKKIMNKYVGHFEETSKNNGNIGLAAHNRGYDVNYFSQIKLLKKGDEIIYKCYDFQKKYTVIENKIIRDTDWSYLEKTEENKITLITCVENEPEYRRCIQGIEKK